MSYEIIKMNDNTWRIEDNDIVRFFLLTGTKKAMVIDSGMTINNAKEIVETITDLPIIHLITHADGDHLGSLSNFDKVYMHSAEGVNYYQKGQNRIDFEPVEDGEIIDLGDRELEVILIPGHTPGSIALLDEKARILFSGDSVQSGGIFMFGPYRNAQAYLKSLKKLNMFRDQFDEIYPSHAAIPVKPELIDALYDECSRILQGGCEYEEVEMWGNRVKKYNLGSAEFLME